MSAVLEAAPPSRLTRSGGALVIELLAPGAVARLAAEARATRTDAVVACTEAAPDPWDRGNPDRRLASSAGGPLLQRLFESAKLAQRLQALTGMAWKALGRQGTYSYYTEPGHYLGVHRDIVSCELACIVCLEISGAGAGGELVVHPWAVRSSLNDVRRAPKRGRAIAFRPGQAAVVLGGLVPHEVTPIVGDRQRIVAPLCFQPVR